jgi:putative ABC transport system permease protein
MKVGTTMIRKLIKSSLTKNRMVSAFVAAFLVLSVALLSSALILTLGVFGTVDRFMESARTPHFMQMHLGPLDRARMQTFVDSREDVVAWEVIEYLNVENSQLRFGGQTLDTEIQQNGFVTQPEQMDFLLSPQGEVIQPRPGEIYVPNFYAGKYDLKPGDQISVDTGNGTMEFTLVSAFRDSQMNSTLASSKRLLISGGDYAELLRREGTAPEHLLSFRLNSPADAASFETAYFTAKLESNGPSLTWPLFRLVNSLNDGVTVMLLIMMSLVILLIAFLCIRYTLLATLQEDLHEIGVMKALGVRNALVSSIYLGKYRVLLGGGAATGFIISLLARNAILANVRQNMGEVSNPVLGVVAGAIGALLLYGLSMLSVRRVLNRLRQITPLRALQGDAGLNPARRPRPILRPTVGSAVNLKLAWANIRRTPSQHLTILAVAGLITLALLVPFRFGSTVRSADFVTYMGIGQYDLRIDLLGRDDARSAADAITAALQSDARVKRMKVYTQEIETAITASGETSPLRIDYGDPAAFPLRYGAGRAPQMVTELGISEINAERFGVSVGDALTVLGPTGAVEFTVSGTYQDVTNGGKTAKALPGPTMDAAHPDMMIAIKAAEGARLEDIRGTITRAVGGVQVIDTGLYVQQMMGDLIRVMDTIAWVFAGVAIMIAALMAGLSIRLMQVQERRANALQGALGFTSRHLRSQYLVRIMLMMTVGVAIGIGLATPVGNLIGNAVFSTLGVSGLSLIFDPWVTVLGSALVLLSAWAVTMLHTGPRANRALVERLRA